MRHATIPIIIVATFLIFSQLRREDVSSEDIRFEQMFDSKFPKHAKIIRELNLLDRESRAYYLDHSDLVALKRIVFSSPEEFPQDEVEDFLRTHLKINWNNINKVITD